MQKSRLLLLFLLFIVLDDFGQPRVEHDIHFNRPVTLWDEGMPLGNGIMGTVIWQKADRLRYSLDRSDLWDERPMKGLHRPEFNYQWVYDQVKKGEYKVVQDYFDAPYDREAAPSKIPGGALEFDTKNWGRILSMHLFLNKAICEVRWQNGVILKTFVHATRPIGWFRFENLQSEFNPEIVPPGYAGDSKRPDSLVPGNDVSRLGYSQGTINRASNRITYHQPGWNGFSYSISIGWTKIGNAVEGVWSINSQIKGAKQIAASQIVDSALIRGFQTDAASHFSWWQQFWSKSSITVPDTLIENQWYRDQYKFGSTARKGAPPILLQGVWTTDNGRLPPWKGDYHHDLNTEMSYWPAYSANHLEEAEGFLDHLDSNTANYRRYTQLFFKTKGVAVPGVTTLQGTEMGGWIQYALSPTVAGWLSQHYYLQWRYTMDEQLLKLRVYPWFKLVAAHFEGISFINSSGFRQLPLSSSPEINNNAINAWFLETTNYDLSLMKFVFLKSAEIAQRLGMPKEAAHYNKLLGQLPGYALSPNNEMMYAPGHPYNESHRHFSHAMAIHPLGLINWEDDSRSKTIITNTIRLLDSIGPDLWNGYSYAWLANLKARAKDGEGAVKALSIFARAFCSVNSFHVNGDQSKSGYSKRTYRPFTLEGNFGFAAGLQEMLLQSHAGFIDLFPAIPLDWKDISFRQLRAEGAFLVSAKKKNGQFEEIVIVSEQGGAAKLKLPFEQYTTSKPENVTLKKSGEFLELRFERQGSIVLRPR